MKKLFTLILALCLTLASVQSRTALTSTEVRYEPEHQLLINDLRQENRLMKTLSIALGSCLVLVCALAGVLMWSMRLRRRNNEQALYQKALEADMLKASTEIAEVDEIKDLLVAELMRLPDSMLWRDEAVERVERLSADRLRDLFSRGTAHTLMDKKYIVLFCGGVKYEHIAAFFNIELASVYTVRYRVKKKFSSAPPF